MRKLYSIIQVPAKLLFLSSLIVVVNTGVPVSVSAQGLSLDQSRIIFTAGQPHRIVTMDNDSGTLYLVQADVRDTAPDGIVSEQWFVTPPLFRLSPHSRQSVKVLLRKGTELLPADRESLFYFSATALPAIPGPASEVEPAARISLGTRLVIKMFYRPADLAVTYEQAAGSVTFTQSSDTLCISNPSPYYLTFSELASEEYHLTFPPGFMLAPFSRGPVTVPSVLKQIHWRTLNDYGGNTPQFHSSVLQGGKKC